jgi:hypothetical protein
VTVRSIVFEAVSLSIMVEKFDDLESSAGLVLEHVGHHPAIPSQRSTLASTLSTLVHRCVFRLTEVVFVLTCS